MSEAGWTDKRPMSPHVQVWKWHVTMLGSILHRVTGFGNYIGAMLLAGWLFAVASGPEEYGAFAGLVALPAGQVVLFLFTLSFCYHLLNGVRHLVLDAGEGYTPKTASFTATLVLILAILLAAAVWLLAGLVPGVSLAGAF